MNCPYHFKGILYFISSNSPMSSKIYFKAVKNFSDDVAIFKYVKSLLFNKFKPFKIVFRHIFILLHIKSDSVPDSNVVSSLFFCLINLSS